MDEFGFEITHYFVRLGLRLTTEVITSEGKKVTINIFSRIFCKGKNDELVRISFFRLADQKSLADIHAKGTFKMMTKKTPLTEIFEPEERFTYYLDILRNEHPIRAQTFTEHGETIIFTGEWEPVGVGDEDYKG